uniref:Uncharacterized protein n=1 Tax=Eutreptiella gymnastica TaxID=73025 RepID=A0A7S1HZV4_9EUGL|mmetsp:Transcript_117730/g.204980  ORF Transcript_117730/g.204980 Transcript_117730/m.204980 type:complete len:146 (+) Transcript_117730:159-596(+)
MPEQKNSQGLAQNGPGVSPSSSLMLENCSQTHQKVQGACSVHTFPFVVGLHGDNTCDTSPWDSPDTITVGQSRADILRQGIAGRFIDWEGGGICGPIGPMPHLHPTYNTPTLILIRDFVGTALESKNLLQAGDAAAKFRQIVLAM